MATILPKDEENNIIPALRLKSGGGAHAVSVSSSSARNSVAFGAGTRVVSLYATGPAYIEFGGSTVTATAQSHYFPGGTYYDVAVGGDKTGHYTHVAALRADVDCTLYISEKE